MDKANLYRSIGQHLKEFPDFNPQTDFVTPEVLKWVAKSIAYANASQKLSATATIQAKAGSVESMAGDRALRDIYVQLAAILYELEFDLPSDVSGAFIPVGSPFEAHASFSKVVSTANSDVLLIDPYLDEKALTEFGLSVPEKVQYRLLADADSVKANLLPAAKKWKLQYKSVRPLDIRLTPNRMLHDRAIIIDRETPWILSQSLNALAARSPAVLVRANEIADLKIPAYEAIWQAAKPMTLT